MERAQTGQSQDLCACVPLCTLVGFLIKKEKGIILNTIKKSRHGIVQSWKQHQTRTIHAIILNSYECAAVYMCPSHWIMHTVSLRSCVLSEYVNIICLPLMKAFNYSIIITKGSIKRWNCLRWRGSKKTRMKEEWRGFDQGLTFTPYNSITSSVLGGGVSSFQQRIHQQVFSGSIPLIPWLSLILRSLPLMVI